MPEHGAGVPDLRQWVRENRIVRLEPAGTQPALFGGEQQMWRAISAVNGSVLLTEDQMRSFGLMGRAEHDSQTSLF